MTHPRHWCTGARRVGSEEIGRLDGIRRIPRHPRHARHARHPRALAAASVALTLAAIAVSCTSSSGTTTTPLAPSTTVRATTTQPRVTRTATIVLVVPASGPLEGLGNEAREGLELAIRHAKEDAKLPADMNMRVRVLDETARGVARAVDRAARNDDVIAIVGGLLESTEATLAPVARRRTVALFTFTWGTTTELTSVVRVGPSRTSIIEEAARFVRSANPAARSIAVVATPGAAGSVTTRDSIAALLSPAEVALSNGPAILTSAPSDPAELAQLPIVVTGTGDSSFETYARLRTNPTSQPPSIIVPADSLGCRTLPTGVASGTRCVSRGRWHGSTPLARSFREDTAAAAITPSWATGAAYDAGSLIAVIATAILRTPTAPSSAVRSRLFEAKVTTPYATFTGVSGRLTTGEGFVGNAQTLLAENGQWVLDAR